MQNAGLRIPARVGRRGTETRKGVSLTHPGFWRPHHARENAVTPVLLSPPATGRAYVRLNGRMLYLGRWGTPTSRAEYDRLIAEWLAHGRRLRH